MLVLIYLLTAGGVTIAPMSQLPLLTLQALIVQTSAVQSLRQESDAQMEKVTRGGQFSVAFSGRGFPRTYPGHPPRPIDGHR